MQAQEGQISRERHTRSDAGLSRVNIDYATLPINLSPSVTPSSLTESQPTIGLIGMGAMGRMYAQRLGAAGWRRFVSLLPLFDKGLQWAVLG
jgi:hypothetical protein